MLNLNEVGKQFGGLVALNNVTFSVDQGEIVSLIGPNGAGKSTLLNVITGFIKPTYGTVQYKEKDITGSEPHRLSKTGIGRTFQIAKIFKQMSVLENVMVGYFPRFKSDIFQGILQTKHARKELNHIRETSYELLKFVGLEKEADVISGNLPYGKIRLVEVARALAGNPELLLLDEPACGLNSSEVLQFIEILRKIQADGKTILLVEHDMRLVMSVSQRLVVLKNGELLAVGLPKEIKENEEVISAYLGKGFVHAAN
ncbi:ABC transporter ATP-binding protein [Neobacillus novalis]|uniref:ABC transporter ATP-binding protein n=1 Tax=Neobacillus novalis TaxID=220687 RepID=A0AA95MJ07_9BACI|nr:ABC transporter ATP-binding protein [Neobacillus novalis]WHY84002.1 ABC transporter ATP-binding protein [Neobacillus novalis]